MKSFANLLISLHEKGVDLKEILRDRKFDIFEKDGNNKDLLTILLDSGTPYDAFKSIVSNEDCLSIVRDQFLGLKISSLEHEKFLEDLIERAESSSTFRRQLLSKSGRQKLIELMINNFGNMDNESIDKMNRLLGGPKETFLKNSIEEFIVDRKGLIGWQELVQFCQKNHLFIDTLSTIENVRVHKYVYPDSGLERIVKKCLQIEDVDLLIKFWKKFPEEISDSEIYKVLSLECLQSWGGGG